MLDDNTLPTTITLDPLLRASGSPLPTATNYRAALGSHQYLLLTHPEVSFVVNKLAQFVQTPTDTHRSALKRLFRKQCGLSRSFTGVEFLVDVDATAEFVVTHYSANPVFHSRMKHLALAFHFARERVQDDTLYVQHIFGNDQLVDVLTI
ncbi:hypothetical protein RND81_12G003900 [Saponaria officinalis]|uniref:Uncharacterized protein n=1 Tax=Saponaria officinalis TaxID=3572 RepID=A0AAW1H3N4_SAPOF